MLHDVGNERRFLIFVPALVALAALVLGRDRTLLPAEASAAPVRKALLALPVVLFAPVRDRRHPRPAGASLRDRTERAPGGGAGAGGNRARLRDLAVDAATACADSRGRPRAGLLVVALVSAGQLAQYRAVGDGTDVQELRRLGRARPTCCRRARSSTASSPTAWRSRTGSSRSSSAVASATTRTGRRATMCDIF